MDSDDILKAIQPQLDAVEIFREFIGEISTTVDPPQAAHALVARLAQHDPPILLCFPDQVKNG